MIKNAFSSFQSGIIAYRIIYVRKNALIHVHRKKKLSENNKGILIEKSFAQ